MTTGNNNGKRKFNGNSKAIAISEPAKTSEQLEKLLEEQKVEQPQEPVAQEAAQIAQPEEPVTQQAAPEPVAQGTTTQEESAEDLLRQAKAATKNRDTQAQEEPNQESGGEITSTASSELEIALSQAAHDLIKTSKQAKQQRLETGIREGFEKAKDIRVGEQLGTLLALAQAESIDASELDEQLEKLRAHTDAETANVVSEAIKKLGITTNNSKAQSPLESTLSRLPSRGDSFKIV